MKKIILTTAIILFAISSIYSQQNYYKGKTQVSGTGFTYDVMWDGDVVFTLKNVKNKYYNMRPLFKDGTHPGQGEKTKARMDFENEKEEQKIFKEVFTQAQILDFARTDEYIIVVYTIDSVGNITEVAFILGTDPKLTAIPPAKFYEMECKARERLKFTVHPTDQQRLVYTHFGSFLVFAKLDEPIVDWYQQAE